MITLTVELGVRSYPIYIGERLLALSELYSRHLAGHDVLIVTNEVVAPLYAETVRAALGDIRHEVVVLPDGEQYKTLETASRLFDTLIGEHFERSVTLIALGGGVVGDITGFAAACYQRGVALLQVPTTLLAQVDSSVGGKTGVNHPLGKNMIGAFHQPNAVIADTSTLTTLDERQVSAGIAEVIKYGLIRDATFFAWLEEHVEDLLNRDPTALAYAIERSCRNKAEVVAADERESGQRALLNLGHTFGHAIETATEYNRLLHGEAVGVGMRMAAELSARLGWLSHETLQRIESLLQRARLPIAPPPGIHPRRFREFMSVDKKVQHGRLRLVLLRDIGVSVVTGEFESAQLDATLAAMCLPAG